MRIISNLKRFLVLHFLYLIKFNNLYLLKKKYQNNSKEFSTKFMKLLIDLYLKKVVVAYEIKLYFCIPKMENIIILKIA